MRRISFFIAFMMILSVLPIMTYAGADFIIENDTVSMPYAEPDLDGVITDGEGWSDAADFDKNTAGHFWAHLALTTSADLYFAHSDEGIYFAGDITERNYVMDRDENGVLTAFRGNGFIHSTGFDDVDGTEVGSDYGWNGDIFSLMIDPMDLLYNSGFTGNEDFSPWYNIGLFKNDDGSETARVYRSKVNKGELTEEDGVRAAGASTKDGWIVEAFIPWSVIAQDISDISFGTVSVTAEELKADGAAFSAAIMYHDRFFDEEGGMVDTWGRFITVTSVCDDGTPGHMSSGDCVKSFGLKLVNSGGASNHFIDIPEGKWYTYSALYCHRNGYMSGTSGNTFGPKDNMDRQMFATILAKIDGADISGYTQMSFSDVKPGQWYSNAIEWAYRNGYASGIGEAVYGRKNPVTREQLALFFYTYSWKNGINVNDVANLASYSDISYVHDWAKPAMAWAVKSGLITGTTPTTLSPRESATRAEVSLIIMNYVRNIK